MNVNIDIDRILEAGAKAVDTAKKTATDLAREGKRQTDLLALQGKKAKAERQLGALVYSLAKTARRTAPWWKNTSPPSARWTTRSTS